MRKNAKIQAVTFVSNACSSKVHVVISWFNIIFDFAGHRAEEDELSKGHH